MRFTRVAWACCLAPVLGGGCHSVYHPKHDHVAESLVAKSEKEIARAIHHRARAAWQEVRCQYSRKAFSAEFRDGFLDGYADYLDRGGDGGPPAVPPLRYTQNPKYFTPEGHVLMRDYFLGFKYGAEVAIATGQRQYLTVPVLVADRPIPVSASPPATIAPPGVPTPKPMLPLPLPTPRPVPSDVIELPTPRVLENETWSPPSKFAPFALQPPVVVVPLAANPVDPLTAVPAIPMLPVSVPPRPEPAVKLPEPPPQVPTLPPGVPTPLLMDDLPMLPPNHTVPPPLPPNHPDPAEVSR